MGRRGPKPQFDREEILDRAQELILARGLSGLTLTRLATGLNTSASALYRYFPSKEAIIVGLQERAIEALERQMRADIEAIDAALADTEMPPQVSALVRCLVLFRTYGDADPASRARRRLLRTFLATPDAVLSTVEAQQVNTILGRVIALSASCLDHAVAEGALAPGDGVQRTHVVWAAYHGLQDFEKRDRIQPPALQVQALGRLLFTTLFQGFGASSEDIDAAVGYVMRTSSAGPVAYT